MLLQQVNHKKRIKISDLSEHFVKAHVFLLSSPEFTDKFFIVEMDCNNLKIIGFYGKIFRSVEALKLRATVKS